MRTPAIALVVLLAAASILSIGTGCRSAEAEVHEVTYYYLPG